MNDEYTKGQALSYLGTRYPTDSITFTVTKIENGMLVLAQGVKDGTFFNRHYYETDTYYVGSRIQTLLDEHEAKPVPPAPWPAPTTDDDVPF